MLIFYYPKTSVFIIVYLLCLKVGKDAMVSDKPVAQTYGMQDPPLSCLSEL